MVLKAQNFQFSTNVALAYNGSAMSSGGFRTTHFQIKNND